MGSPGTRPGYDWITDSMYRPFPLPPALRHTTRVELVTWAHTCPDGTEVTVTGQYIALTDTTLYRWRTGSDDELDVYGVPGHPVAPDFTAADAAHPVAA